MEIVHKNIMLNADIYSGGNDKKCVLFLCGGSLDTGKERFLAWQREFRKIGISSVAFDYTGVPGNRDSVRSSSLQSRIEEVVTVVSWIKEEIKPAEIIVYGVSMGGYIALGATASVLSDEISKLVLHAPAAYAKTAHELLFDASFTEIISQSKSWNDSRSFSWLEQFEKPILFIQPEHDAVIPGEITKKYLRIGNEKADFTHMYLRGAGHTCWSNSAADITIRKELYTQLVNFV